MDDWKDHWMSWIPVLEKELLDEDGKGSGGVGGARPGSYSPGYGNVATVWGKKLDADPEILVAAVYLHDLGRHYIPDTAHGALSAQKAEPVLERIHFPTEKRERVLHAIRVHDVSATSDQRTSIESKILYDADKIDTLGVIGILRYIRHYYGKKPIDYMLDDIEQRWQGLALPETRELALGSSSTPTNLFFCKINNL